MTDINSKILSTVKNGQLEIIVWWENTCDDVFNIQDSCGFSLEVLNKINEDFKLLDWSQYLGNHLIVRPVYLDDEWGYEIISKKCLGEI